MKGWKQAGLPVLVIEMENSEQGFGAAFFEWEFGVAVACYLIGVNAFNQPDVQSAKSATVELLKHFEKKGSLPKAEILWEDPSLTVRGDHSLLKNRVENLDDLVRQVLMLAKHKGGFGLLLYLPQKTSLEKALSRTRGELRDRLGIATLHGFGPRYLHSTGQLHKGGADQAVYCIVTSERTRDVLIPGYGYGFQLLQEAQAVADVRALKNAGRRVVHVELSAIKHIKVFFTALQSAAAAIEDRPVPK